MYNRKVIIDAIRNLNKSKKQPKYNKDYTNNSSTQKKKDNVITGENGVNAPVYKSIQIGPSKIHGKGVFSQEPIAKGDVIGVSHIRKNFTKNGQQYQAPFPSTQLGGYYNHSESPNIQEVDNNDHILLLAKRNINPGEELTSNYYNHNIDDLETPDKFKKGGSSKRPEIPSKKNSKAYSRSFEATNKFFAQNPLFKKSKSRKNKIFDPNAKYYADGGAKTKDLPKASYGLTGLGKDRALTFTPFDFRTAYGQVGDFNVNPNYSLSYTTPDLFKKMDVSGNPLTFTIGRPYKTDAQSLTNPTRSFMGEYSLPYNDPAMAGPNPQYDAFLQDVSDYTNTPLSQLSTTQVNQYNAAKNLEGAKQIYKKGIPLTANIGYDLYGNAFGDSSSGPFTGSLGFNAGYAPESGLYGSFDTSIMGVFGKRKNNATIRPNRYFDKGLTRQGDMAFIPKLNILNAIIRQRPEYNDAQTQKILDLYAQDIQQGTTTADEFLQNQSDQADRYDISFLSPELTFQAKPFKKIPGVLSATAGLRLDYEGKADRAQNSIPITPNPYGNIRYTVPIEGAIDKLKDLNLPSIKRKKTYEDYANDQEYDEEYTGDMSYEDTPTETDNQINPPQIQLNPNGTVIGRGDCPEGYERPCEKCRCQKIKMPQRYTDKRGTQLFGNEPIRFKNGGLSKFVDGGPQCPEGFTYDEKTKRCIRKNTTCPEGYFYDAQEGRCKSKAYREKSQLYSKGNKIIPTEEQEKYSWWPDNLTVKNLEPRVNLIEPEKRLSIYQPDVDDIKYAWSPVEIDIYPDLNYEVVADSSKPKGFNEDKSIYYVPDENNFEFEKFKQYKKLKEIEKENLENISKYPNLTTTIESGYNWEDKYLNPEYNSFSDRNKPLTFDEYKNIKKNEYEECTDCTYGHGEKISYDDDDRITEQNLAHVYNKFYEIPDYETRFEREYDYVDLPDESIIPKLDLATPSEDAPLYLQPEYQMSVPTIEGKKPIQKIKRFITGDKGVIDRKGHIKFGDKDVNRPIPALVQRLTGYNPDYMEGYENEDGEYIPGEIERAEQEGRKINFKGASSLRDLKNQKEYERQWSEYQKQKDEVRQQNETYLQEYGITPEEYTSVYGQFQDGGEQDAMNAMMKARLAYANMFGNPAAQRMINIPDQPYEFDNGDTGTHYMASMDNYAVPQIQDENGQLMLGNYGPESREAIRFDSDEDANYFAENYKDVSPGFIDLKLTQKEIDKYVKGGYIVEDISVPSLSNKTDIPKARFGRITKEKKVSKEPVKADPVQDMITKISGENLGQLMDKENYDVINTLKDKEIISQTLNPMTLMTYPNLLDLATRRGIQDALTFMRSTEAKDYGISTSGTKTDLAPRDLDAIVEYDLENDKVGQALYAATHIPNTRYGQRSGLSSLPYNTEYVNVFRYGEGPTDYVVANDQITAAERVKLKTGKYPSYLKQDYLKQGTPDSLDALYTFANRNTPYVKAIKEGTFSDLYGPYKSIVRYPFDYSGSASNMLQRFVDLENYTSDNSKTVDKTSGKEGAKSGDIITDSLIDKNSRGTFYSLQGPETAVIGNPGQKVFDPVATYYKPGHLELEAEKENVYNLLENNTNEEIIDYVNDKIKQGEFSDPQTNINLFKEDPEFAQIKSSDEYSPSVYINYWVDPKTGLVNKNMDKKAAAQSAAQSYLGYLEHIKEPMVMKNTSDVIKIPYSPFRFKFEDGGEYQTGGEKGKKKKLKRVQNLETTTTPIDPDYLAANPDIYSKIVNEPEVTVLPNVEWLQDRANIQPNNIKWYESWNPKKWGLNDYSDYSSFNSAFRNARASKQDEFIYKDKRYNTDLIPEEESDLYWESKNFLKDYYQNEPYRYEDEYGSGAPSDYNTQEWFIKNKYGTTWLDLYNKIEAAGPNDPKYVEMNQLLSEIMAEEMAIQDKTNKDYSNYRDSILGSAKQNLINARLSSLDKPSYFSITSQKPKSMSSDGYWDTKNNRTFMYTKSMPGKLNTTYVHELSHKGDEILDVLETVPDIDVEKINMSPYVNSWDQEDFNYVSNPSEIEARKLSTLFYLYKNKKPYKSGKITQKMLDDLYTNSENLPYDIKQLLDLYGMQQDDLLKYLNGDFSYKEQKKQYGGEYELGDEVDEATMQKLKENGYTFEIVK
jgi:hypothetical protein